MNNKDQARQRSSTSQNFFHAMPAACNYRHLTTIIKDFNTSFLSNRIIKKIFLVEITTNNEISLHETFTNPTFRLYKIKSSNTSLSGLRWPQSHNLFPIIYSLKTGVNFRKQTSVLNKNLNNTLNLKTGELFVFLIHVITKHPQTHASAAVVHKKSDDKIEFFVLEPHGTIYDYHKKIAKKYFNVHPDNMHLPFDKIQGTNKICVAHSKALLFRFLQNYKQYGNLALKTFRTSKTTFSKPPILNVAGSLGRSKSGRITYAKRNSATSTRGNSARGNSARGNSARGNSARGKSARGKFAMIRRRIQVDPTPSPTNTRNVELSLIKLLARERGHLNNDFKLVPVVSVEQVIKNLQRNALNTYHFRNFNQKKLLDLLDISRV